VPLPNLRSNFHRPEFIPHTTTMSRFFTGDELGNIKSFKYVPSSTADSNVTVSTLYDGSGKGKERAVQKLATSTSGDGPLVRQSPSRRQRCLHMLTGSRSKDSSRTQRRLCFCLQTTCRGLRHATRVDRTASKARPKIRRSSRVVRVGPFLSRRTAQPAKLTTEP
jgi:hypothetical protein